MRARASTCQANYHTLGILPVAVMLLGNGLSSSPLSAEELQNQAYPQERQLTQQPGYLEAEYIYDQASFPSCHASTIAETPSGLVAAWFGGSDEGEPDVGIWLSRHHTEGRNTEGRNTGGRNTGAEGHWSAPVEVANGIQYQSGGVVHRHPCWNPVLFQSPQGPLLLFYKVGPNPEQWWGMLTTSTDGGKSWDQPRRLPEGIDGPVKNKPIVLPGGDLLCGSSTEYDGWRIHLERTSDLGKSWHRIGPLHGRKNGGQENEAIQPSILTYSNNRLQLLCRNRNGRGQLLEAWSFDGGTSWSDLSETTLPNPNSGTDAVTLTDGRQLLVYNHTHRGSPFPSGRNMLNVAISIDGTNWQAALLLERQPGEYSYPAVIQSYDGLVHITYTWQRKKIRHVVVDPTRLQPVEMRENHWPHAHLGAIDPERPKS